MRTFQTASQSGSGFFVFNNTGPINSFLYNGNEEVYGTPAPIAVLPNTDYEFSFYLTNNNTIANASIEPFINGISLGSPVTAVGTFATDGWQQFAFLWNSDAATTADLSLVNRQSTTIGNDFGLDTVELTPLVTEPIPFEFEASATAFALGSLFGFRRLRRRQRKATA